MIGVEALNPSPPAIQLRFRPSPKFSDIRGAIASTAVGNELPKWSTDQSSVRVASEDETITLTVQPNRATISIESSQGVDKRAIPDRARDWFRRCGQLLSRPEIARLGLRSFFIIGVDEEYEELANRLTRLTQVCPSLDSLSGGETDDMATVIVMRLPGQRDMRIRVQLGPLRSNEAKEMGG